jgi:hypothetical protein
MAVIIHGTGKIPIFGVCEPMPAEGFPEGRIRWRIRNNDFVKAYVKTSDGIREFRVIQTDGYWMPIYEQGRNRRTNQ